MLIDTHAHLYDDAFADDFEAMLERAGGQDVKKVFLPNVDTGSIRRLMEISERHPDLLYPMMGLHPCSVKENYLADLKLIELELSKHRFYAVGEIGIDLYWDKNYYAQQCDALCRQVQWANALHLPVVIHSRESTDEIIALFKKEGVPENGGIFHCFSGNEAQARTIIDMGFMLGIGGVVTFKNATLPEVLKAVGPDHLVLETDAPYLAPAPHRGKRNESAYVQLVAQKVADIFELRLAEVAEITSANACKVFRTER